jgi:hypothetical protein
VAGSRSPRRLRNVLPQKVDLAGAFSALENSTIVVIYIRPLKSSRLFLTIVIDALDECKDKEPVSQFLSTLARHANEISKLKILITGRLEDHIRADFLSLRMKMLPLHDVESAIVDSDIESGSRKFLLENSLASLVLGHRTETSCNHKEILWIFYRCLRHR